MSSDVSSTPDTAWLEGEPALLGAAETVAISRKRRRIKRKGRRPDELPQAASEVEGWSGTVHVFEPRGAAPVPLRQYLRDVWARRPLIAEMARSELRGKHAGTALGSLWTVLDPAFQAAIYYFLFAVIRGGRGKPVEFIPLIVLGIFCFRLTGSALGDGGRAIRRGKGLMINSAFPRAVLPLMPIYKGLVAFPASLFVIVVVHRLFGAPVEWSLLLLPVVFLIQTVLNVGLALFVATLIVFFQDTSNLLSYVNRILLLATPIIYPLDLLPDRIRGVLEWQPLYPIFASYQQLLNGDVPELAQFLRGAGWAIGFLVVGFKLFRRYEWQFASHI